MVSQHPNGARTTARPQSSDRRESSVTTSVSSARSVALLEWHAHEGRDLPWRSTRDPWAVLVSELMLQQTQVVRVAPKYLAFMARFPSIESCAASTPGEVVTMWAGLGYNRRALNLHRSAVVVVQQFEGRLPNDLGDLMSLPGVGPYTARAVLAFAFERDVGVVDVNASRVLARWVATPLTRRQAQELANMSVPTGQGWAWNQAMLDLGATVCTARHPRCDGCPVRMWCGWDTASPSSPDPAFRSAITSTRQTRFDGSDRQGRGRLVEVLRQGSVAADMTVVARHMGWPHDPDRASVVLEGLLADGLVVRDESSYRLP